MTRLHLQGTDLGFVEPYYAQVNSTLLAGLVLTLPDNTQVVIAIMAYLEVT